MTKPMAVWRPTSLDALNCDFEEVLYTCNKVDLGGLLDAATPFREIRKVLESFGSVTYDTDEETPFREIRKVLESFGSVTYDTDEATSALIATVDPKLAHQAVVTLCMLARSDAAGLCASIGSMVPYCDRIIVGIDDRSDNATRELANLFADEVYTFTAKDIGLTEEEWAADKIHFSNARNIGRRLAKTPWIITIDTDERLIAAKYPFSFVKNQLLMLPSTKNAHFINVISDGQVNRDGQRLTRSDLMWENATHNQLRPIYVDSFDLEIDIVHDVSLRAAAEVERRTTQRNNAMNEMSENALDSDDPSFLLHAAKHALSLDNIDQALKFVEAFRAKAPVHGELSGSRALLALYLAVYYLGKENYEQAEVWALRVLFDGPNIMAMCLLGDIAAMRDDLRSAVGWYSAGCAVDAEHEHIVPIEWHVVLENREERLRELQVAYKESLKDATDSSIPKE